MAGLYDFNFREQNKIPAPVGNKDLYQLNKPVIDYTRMVNPTLNPVEAVSQKTKNDIQKASDTQIAADQKILDQRNNMRALKEMESIGQGHPFTPQTPTPAQGYATAEDLSLAANSVDTDLDKKMTGQRRFTNLLLNKPTPFASLSDAKNTPAPVETIAPQNLPPTYAEIKKGLEQSALENPDDPRKWGLSSVLAHETSSGTQMPNGWGMVKDSKGNVHIAPPSKWNFYGDTQAEQNWRDQQEAADTQREINRTLREEAINARSNFVGPKRRAQAVDSMLGLQSIKQGGTNATTNSLINAMLNRQAALDKEGRERTDKAYATLMDYAKMYEQSNPGQGMYLLAKASGDPSFLKDISSMNPSEMHQRIAEQFQAEAINNHVKMNNPKGQGLRDTTLGTDFNLPTWVPFVGENLYTNEGNHKIPWPPDWSQRRAMTITKLKEKFDADIQSGAITPEEALVLLNTELANRGFTRELRY